MGEDVFGDGFEADAGWAADFLADVGDMACLADVGEEDGLDGDGLDGDGFDGDALAIVDGACLTDVGEDDGFVGDFVVVGDD